MSMGGTGSRTNRSRFGCRAGATTSRLRLVFHKDKKYPSAGRAVDDQHGRYETVLNPTY